MSEYTTRQILDLIEANGGPEGLALSGKDLTDIQLDRSTIRDELARVRVEAPGASPLWWSGETHSIYLTEANLRGANLQLASLEGANLVGADLEGASVRSVNLKGAYLLFANLRCAYPQLANLEGANLLDADLEGAIVRLANFEGAYLWHANLKRVDLSHARSLAGAYLYNTELDLTKVSKDQFGEAIGEDLDGDWAVAKEVYLSLKNGFEQAGRFDDASWAYRKERRMEKLKSWEKATNAQLS